MSTVNNEVNADGPQPDGGAGSSTPSAPVVVNDDSAALKAGEEITAAITEFEPPETHEVVPKPSRASSQIYKYGVKLRETETGKWSFACLASPACREKTRRGTFIAISEKAASNANDHIKTAHNAEVSAGVMREDGKHARASSTPGGFDFGIDCAKSTRGTSRKTLAATEKTDRLEMRVMKAVSSGMFATNKPRFRAVTWVKCHIVEGFCPLSHGDKEWVRACLKLTGAEDFPITSIDNKAVKHIIIEMYAATASRFKKEMASEVGGMRLLHLNLDLWVDKFSSLKYIGIRLFYVDRQWQLKSRLIAVRQFNPSQELLSDNRLSDLLELYLESVLEEYGLDTTLLFSATSDAGSDVKRLCKVLLPGLWEWCVCHMINCSLVEAFGTHVDPAKSHNPAARKVVMTVKKVVEHIRKSPRAKVVFEEEQVLQYAQCSHRKLVNAAPQRWSGVANVMEAVIVNRSAIDGVYTAESKDSPLTAISNEIDELYSIIKPAAEVIVKCQKTYVPTGQAAVLALAALKLTTLNVRSPLEILTPAPKRAQGGTGGIGGGERPASSAPRQHSLLTAVARDTREHLLHSVDWRWFDKRYKDTASEDTDYVFDMQMALHPTTADLRYVNKLAPTSARATTVKSAITEAVISLAVEMAEEAAAKEGGSSTPAEPAVAQPAAKRARRAAAPGSVHPIFRAPVNKKQEATTNAYASLGLFGPRGDEADEQPPSSEERARVELTKLRAVKGGRLTADLSCEDVLSWWKKWAGSYPLLARVARVVFGAPASAAVLERDLSDAGRMMTSSRSTMDTKYVEMILFLHGNLDLMPAEIPALTEAGARNEIPGRLVDPVAGLEQLDGAFGPVDLTDEEEESV
ncbi:unnamed protein product [Scytosiphon promiscuus]